MFSYVLVLALATSAVLADPEAKPSGLIAAPLAVAPAVVTAHSSQVFNRHFNALAAPLVAAAPVVAPAAPFVARAAPLVAPAAPLVAPAAPLLSSYSYRVASPYLSSPYLSSPYLAASPYVAAPLL